MLEMTASLHGSDNREPVAVYARKEPHELQAYVVVRTPDDRELRLTVDEVDQFIERLSHMAWVAMQDGRKRDAFELGRDFEGGQRR